MARGNVPKAVNGRTIAVTGFGMMLIKKTAKNAMQAKIHRVNTMAVQAIANA